MTDIPEGHGIIAGRSGANARAAIAAAQEAGVDTSLVIAVPEGYLVPEAVLDAFHAAIDGTANDPEATPTSDWKNADIEQWASDHGVDLGGATKKADMLDAISGAEGD
jgi:hypothetical protein